VRFNTRAKRPEATGPSLATTTNVKPGNFHLTRYDKIGYNSAMFADIALFMIRLLFVAAVCGFAWTFVRPKTQPMRIARAALLVSCLLIALLAMRAASV
jgi:hypothetical protein